jgi:hypothetical protein
MTSLVTKKMKILSKVFATKLASALVLNLQEDKDFAQFVITNLNTVSINGVACLKKKFAAKTFVTLKTTLHVMAFLTIAKKDNVKTSNSVLLMPNVPNQINVTEELENVLSVTKQTSNASFLKLVRMAHAPIHQQL